MKHKTININYKSNFRSPKTVDLGTRDHCTTVINIVALQLFNIVFLFDNNAYITVTCLVETPSIVSLSIAILLIYL